MMKMKMQIYWNEMKIYTVIPLACINKWTNIFENNKQILFTSEKMDGGISLTQIWNGRFHEKKMKCI